MPTSVLGSLAGKEHYERSSAELDQAIRFYDQAGWLDDPSGYFATPTEPPTFRPIGMPAKNGTVELLEHESGWEPHPGEVGGERWRSFAKNAAVPVALLRHHDGPRPWLIALHGQGMGRPSDAGRLRVRRLHEELGVNVALPVLPLHGRRMSGIAPDRLFVSNVYPVNNVLGLSQAMWDLRRLLLWLRHDQGATDVGVLGFSLGSFAASLLTTLDGDLACVVAIVPSGDLAGPLRAAEPLGASKKKLHRHVHDWRSETIHRVVSPLERPCLVPAGRRFIVAGQGDRVAPPGGAVLLWRHWEEPDIEWRPRGHMTTATSADYDVHLASTLTRSGLFTT